MIMQEQYVPIATAMNQRAASEPLLIDCPVCGHPAKIRQQLLGASVACGHCNGTFIVTEQLNGTKIARSISSVIQANRSVAQRRSAPTRRTAEILPRPRRCAKSSLRPAAFVIEPRDEVYARLAGDLIEAGYRVVRAGSSTDAIKACGTYQPRVVVASLAFPTLNAWQLAPRLATFGEDMQVMLYDVEIAIHDYAMADFLGIEQLIEYGGDLFRLSTYIRQALGCQSLAQNDSKHPVSLKAPLVEQSTQNERPGIG